MKVIIKKDNSVKDVNEGYAQNYLIPKGLAIVATPQELQKREKQLKEQEESRKKQNSADQALAKELEGKTFVIKTQKIGKEGKLNGSITPKEISEKTQIPKLYLQLVEPIKEAGVHRVELKIGQFHTKITLIVEREA